MTQPRALSLALFGVIVAIAPGKVNSLFFIGMAITIVGLSLWWRALTRDWSDS